MLKFDDFQTPPPPPPPSLYAFKQWNDDIKTIDVRFCLDPLPPRQSLRTLWMVPKILLSFVFDSYTIPSRQLYVQS